MDLTRRNMLNIVDNSKDREFLSFCQDLLGFNDVSLRLVAEREDLKEKLLKLNGNGSKLEVIKLLSHEAPLEARSSSAEEFNVRGYAVFWMPTRFAEGYEETYSAAKSFRAFIVDLDGAPIAPVLDFSVQPTVIVESSPGKYQAVWVLETEIACIKTSGLGSGITCDEYNSVAASLAALFNGDLNAARATQPFRAPGFTHWKKKEGFQSHIFWTKQTPNRCTYESLQAALSGNRKVIAERIKSRRAANSVSKQGGEGELYLDAQYEVSPLDLESLRCGEIKVGRGERHNTILRLATALYHEGKNENEVKETCTKIISECVEGGEEFTSGSRAREFEIILRDACRYAVKNKQKEAEKLTQIISASESLHSKFEYNFGVGALREDKYTEAAVIERTLQRFEGDFARVDDRFFCFDGVERVWAEQRERYHGEVQARLMKAIKDTINEKDFIVQICSDSKGNFSESKAHSAKATFYKAANVNSMSRGVMNHKAITKLAFSDFDAKENLLYVAQGVLNLDTGQVRDATASDRLFKRTKIEYDSGASCPGWLKFVSEIFAENDDPAAMAHFLAQLFGYSLSGEISEQKIFCHSGDGLNGKSKTLDALATICGGYASSLEPEDLVTKKQGFSKAFERVGAKVEGSRCIIIDDFEVDSAWNEGFVKTLTGPSFRARAEYEKSRVIINRTKFHIGMNKVPTVQAENLGILRRLCFIPYPRRFTQNTEKGRELDALIKAEAKGILAWAVRGYQSRKGHSLDYPAETIAALESYKQEHFHYETALEALYEKPSSELDGSWEPLGAIVEDVAAYFRSNSAVFNVSNDELGHAFKRAGYRQMKKWNSKFKNTVSHYLVKLRFSRTENHAVGLV